MSICDQNLVFKLLRKQSSREGLTMHHARGNEDRWASGGDRLPTLGLPVLHI